MHEDNPTPIAEPNKQPRWSRPEVATTMALYKERLPVVISQRQFAVEAEVPRTTFQYWIARKDSLAASRAVAEFFESPDGLAVLHRILGAAQLVFTQVGPCGVDLVSLFLEMSRLNQFVGSSHGTQHEVSRQVQKAIVEFGQQERQRLAAEMSPKKITVCEDETFHPETCLVGIEPVSGFILVEQYSEKQDAASWNGAVKEATKGLAVEIVQATSDEAPGLLAHARQGLFAHHSPDLFHVEHEVAKGVCPALAARVREAVKALEQAEIQTQTQKARRDAFDILKPRPPGRRPQFEARIQKAEQQHSVAGQTLAQAVERQAEVKQAINGLSSSYHPYDLKTGAQRSAQEVARQLQQHFDQIEKVVKEAGLSERAQKHVEKARRVLDAMILTITFVHLQVLARIGELALGVEVHCVVMELLVPGLYLQRVAAKAPTAERRKAIQGVSALLLAQARAPDSPLSSLDQTRRTQVERVAQECADLFQRSSSCVEGRNGQLALRHHSLHRLSTRKLQALTVIHNFLITRPDGTTAAERFFGAKPADLFEWILTQIAFPVRPAKSRVLNHIRAA